MPPFIAKTFVPPPLHFLLHIGLVISIFKFWYRSPFSPYSWKEQPWYKAIGLRLNKVRSITNRYQLLYFLKVAIAVILSVFAFLYIFNSIAFRFGSGQSSDGSIVTTITNWLKQHGLYANSKTVKIFTVIVVIIFIRRSRLIIIYLLGRTWKILALLPGRQSVDFAKRYINIGRFALYGKQGRIFQALAAQYPIGTGFVLLPMDMEFMDAGKTRKTFDEQMDSLIEIKQKNPDTAYPFVFIDPRRMGDPKFFNYTQINGKVIPGECRINELINVYKFSGFKIYPALGYYPFDSRLLALWKYAADNEIPIITHCIRGTIFYRGKKEKSWDQHEVFRQFMGSKSVNGKKIDNYIPLQLPQTKNIEFSYNFTHPMNYLCLLKEELLRIVIGQANDGGLNSLFGYTSSDKPLAFDLAHLKLCFGHYGGDDEWEKYFESDRDQYSPQLLSEQEGIDFLHNQSGQLSWAKMEQLWKYTDWYSLISSMILQHPNIYADISYILHNDGIVPLLNRTLARENRKLTTGKPLRDRVLFGTDFYVVRNHKSDKEMFADLLNNLDADEWDFIARQNPREFLFNKIHGQIPI